MDVVVPRKRQKRLKPEEIDELVALYEFGLSVNQLADLVKIHRTTVMAHLKRRGIQTRPAVRKLTDEQVKTAAATYNSGSSLKPVGAVFGVDAETIRREFVRLDVPRRV